MDSANDLFRLWRRLAGLQARRCSVASRPAHAAVRDALRVREVLVEQQQSAERARKDAEKEAELIVMDAEVKAADLVSEAKKRVQVLTETVRELQDKRMSVLSQIRSFIDSQEKMVEMEEARIKRESVADRERLPEEEEGDGPILELSEL